MIAPPPLEMNLPRYKMYEYQGTGYLTADLNFDILAHHTALFGGVESRTSIPTTIPGVELQVEVSLLGTSFYTLRSCGRSIVRWTIRDYVLLETTVGKLSGPNALPFYLPSEIPADAVFQGESDDWSFGSAQ